MKPHKDLPALTPEKKLKIQNDLACAKTTGNILNALLDFIFPKMSIISDERIDDNNSNQYLNDNEINALPKVTDLDLAELNSKIIANTSFSYFAFREGDDFSKLIYQLKYGGMRRLGEFLGELLGRELKHLFEKENIVVYDFIIPVPLYKTKLRERGFNQSDFICKGVSKHMSGEFIPDIIKRVKHTSTQTKLNREQRIDNMKDAFEINPKYSDKLSGKRVILIDDVVTTGSTLNEVIKVLKVNECEEVMACTIAMAR